MKSWPKLKLGQVIMWSNLVLSTLIWPQNTICLSYKYFLVVIFALRLHRRATLTRFNLGLNNTTPHAHAFPPSSCGLTRHRPASHLTGYPELPVTSLYSLSLMVFLDWFQQPKSCYWTRLDSQSYIRTSCYNTRWYSFMLIMYLCHLCVDFVTG